MMHEQFINYLFTQYQHNCSEKRLGPNIANFLDYLLSHNLISKDTIRHYTIWQKYEYLMKKGKYKNKTEAVEALADQFQIHVNTVWNVVRGNRFQTKVRVDYRINFEE